MSHGSTDIALLKSMLKVDPKVAPPVETARQMQAEYGCAAPLPDGWTRRDVVLGGVPCLELSGPEATSEGAILLLHAGGYSSGSAADHAGFAASLGLAAGVRSYAVDYRLAPDLAQTGESYTYRAEHDSILSAEQLNQLSERYLYGHDPADPLASPLNGSFEAFPPLLIDVGADEVLLSDAIGLAQRAALHGGEVKLNVWKDMIHIFPWFYPHLREGRAAIAAAGVWIASRLGEERSVRIEPTDLQPIPHG